MAVAPVEADSLLFAEALSSPDARGDRAWTNGSDTVRSVHVVYRSRDEPADLLGGLGPVAPDSLVIQERLVGPLPSSGRILRQAVVSTPDGPILVWYWYRSGGIEASTALERRFLQLRAFFNRTRQAEAIALVSSCQPRACDIAARALFELGSELQE